MKRKNLDSFDERPKRRKDKSNPYSLLSIGRNTPDPHYFVSVKTGQNEDVCVEISDELFKEFDRWELEDVSQMNEVDRHYEHSEITEHSKNARAIVQMDAPERIVFRNLEKEALLMAMRQLTRIQCRRLIMHFWEGLSYTEIGRLEGCKYQAVQSSIKCACKKLGELLQERLV